MAGLCTVWQASGNVAGGLFKSRACSSRCTGTPGCAHERWFVLCVQQCEDLEDSESLRHMYTIVRGAIMLNDANLLDLLLSEENVMDVVRLTHPICHVLVMQCAVPSLLEEMRIAQSLMKALLALSSRCSAKALNCALAPEVSCGGLSRTFMCMAPASIQGRCMTGAAPGAEVSDDSKEEQSVSCHGILRCCACCGRWGPWSMTRS